MKTVLNVLKPLVTTIKKMGQCQICTNKNLASMVAYMKLVDKNFKYDDHSISLGPEIHFRNTYDDNDDGASGDDPTFDDGAMED